MRALRLLAFLGSTTIAAACTTVGPSGAREHWRVVTAPGAATVATSFGATCRTPCNIRIPDQAFDITVTKPGYQTWGAHYDADRGGLSGLARRSNQAIDAAGGAAFAAGGAMAAGGELAGATLVGGAAALGALPWLAAPPVRRLEITLAAL